MRVNVSINYHRFQRRSVPRSRRFSAEKLSLLEITLSNLRNRSMTQTSLSTITRINRDELVRLSEKGRANPGAVRTPESKDRASTFTLWSDSRLIISSDRFCRTTVLTID